MEELSEVCIRRGRGHGQALLVWGASATGQGYQAPFRQLRTWVFLPVSLYLTFEFPGMGHCPESAGLDYWPSVA